MCRGPFLERPGNLSGPKANFKIKTCGILAQFLAHKPDQITSITDVSLFYFQTFETLILNANTTNTKQLSGPEKIPGLSRNRPLVSNPSTMGSNKKATVSWCRSKRFVFDALSTNLMSQKKHRNRS